jgi:hypothetical protein
VLTQAARTHHVVYELVDGDDPDWASWYADWLLTLSRLPELLGERPVRSELVYELVALARAHEAKHSDEPWQDFYARALVARFRAA